MIYNLHKYVKTKLPSVSIGVAGYTNESPDECVMLFQSGGIVSHYLGREDYTVQFISRYRDMGKALSELMKVYTAIKNIFRITLPAVTINGTVYPLLIAWQISPMQSPGYIGTDENGRHMYSVNFIVTI